MFNKLTKERAANLVRPQQNHGSWEVSRAGVLLLTPAEMVVMHIPPRKNLPPLQLTLLAPIGLESELPAGVTCSFSLGSLHPRTGDVFLQVNPDLDSLGLCSIYPSFIQNGYIRCVHMTIQFRTAVSAGELLEFPHFVEVFFQT
jgi:hypothetical protein